MGFVAVDEMRRWYGRGLDLWLARTETPSRVVLERPGVELHDYGHEENRPALLIIPAPIKKPYIWDLMPSVSVVLACLQARFQVYILEWTETPPNRSDSGLAVYADELILECAKAINGPAVLAGHSLGGTFATIFAARHPERVLALILLEAPLSFSGDAGVIADLIRVGPVTESLRKVSAYPGTPAQRAGRHRFSGELSVAVLARLAFKRERPCSSAHVFWSSGGLSMSMRCLPRSSPRWWIFIAKIGSCAGHFALTGRRLRQKT
jgi:pimeloyl-ACP methyl ester carboxylesterase